MSEILFESGHRQGWQRPGLEDELVGGDGYSHLSK
jgi:hypothetical protein